MSSGSEHAAAMDRQAGTGPATGSTASPRQKRRLIAAAVALGGAVLSGGLFLAARMNDQQREKAGFEARAAQMSKLVEINVQVQLEALRALPAFFDASKEVSRAEFSAFVQGSLQRHKAIYAFEWIPVVAGNDRTTVEASARADGIAGFTFKDQVDGKMVPSAHRAEHLPILYMEPPNPTPLGFDVASEAARRAPADLARDSGLPVASPRIRLVEDPPDVFSVAVFHPVYRVGHALANVEQRRSAILGYAVEVFRIHPVVEEALHDSNLDGMGLELTDRDGPPELRLLDRWEPGGALERSEPLRWERAFAVADRTWVLTVSGYGAFAGGTSRAWWLLFGGLAISLLAGTVVAGWGEIHVLRRQVQAARQLGQYTLLDKLGEGGMGVVYTARHALLRRPTAIKLLLPDDENPTRLARFEREVQLTAQLTHPNTIAVYDFGRSPDGVFYYAMEYIDGISLEDLGNVDGPQPAPRVAAILRQVCGSLAEAHEAGLIHRDIKPANIMICRRAGIDDFVKVLDFGLAKEIDRGAEATELSIVGALIGTPLYLAPEAISGSHELDGRVDLYSAGAVAYFLLTGAPVFEGQTLVEVCSRHLYTQPVPVQVRAPDVPDELARIVMRCLEKDPAKRHATARALLAELEAFQPGPWEQAGRWWTERADKVRQATSSVAKAPTVPRSLVATIEARRRKISARM